MALPGTPWTRLPTRASRGLRQFPPSFDRRRKTIRNRSRRFLNNYWLVPVFAVYLELFAVVLPSGEPPLEQMFQRNASFAAGAGVLYDLASRDFPYTLIGHAKEIVIRKRFDLDLGQVPFTDLSLALEDSGTGGTIHRRLLKSREDHTTEWGGVATLSRGPDGPILHLYEIPSVNGEFSRDIRKAGLRPAPEFAAWVGEEEHRTFLREIGISEPLVERLLGVLASPRIGKGEKRRLIEQFIAAYNLYSESRYLLSPFALKSFLGSRVLEGEYVGIFHFHNDAEPPSEADLKASDRDRQIVVSLAADGVILYDLVRGEEKVAKFSAPGGSSKRNLRPSG